CVPGREEGPGHHSHRIAVVRTLESCDSSAISQGHRPMRSRRSTHGGGVMVWDVPLRRYNESVGDDSNSAPSPSPRSPMLAHRTHVAVSLLCGLGFLVLSLGFAAADDEKAKAAEAKEPEISKVSNEDLLKQANAILARGSGDYLAAARALA